MAQEFFTTDADTLAAAVKSFDACAQAITKTISDMRRTADALRSSNYQGKQADAFNMVHGDLLAQTREVERAIGLEGLGGMVRDASSAYQNLDQSSASSFNKVSGGAVFSRLVG